MKSSSCQWLFFTLALIVLFPINSVLARFKDCEPAQTSACKTFLEPCIASNEECGCMPIRHTGLYCQFGKMLCTEQQLDYCINSLLRKRTICIKPSNKNEPIVRCA